ncbi:glycosyltransferase [Mucilaginibacter pallidiroseus]|uniref:Glycosyltransferase n=1 Tax=Mucilaginibacter pallidiroseus TaxID=2599295 RepID=A0A563UJS1_9SPHI|nr:glycosyltransferase [Mucilaginibacter pallidiroseus]TWR31536.1 glycosyltransferase [Mucilaginibacter pallidiroseus]
MITASIVVPTYKRPKLLINCLKALLAQSFDRSNYEIIVVSDGPDRDTEQIFQDFAGYDYPALRYLPLPKKMGPAAARNFGWQNAKGTIIAFTDDDCLPHAHWLREIVNNCNPNLDQVVTGRVIVPISKRPTDYELNTSHLQTADFITANCACTKKALIKAGGFDEQFSMAWREDSDLEFKFINNNIPITKVETAIVTHPVRKSAWGVSIKEQKKTQYDALLYKKHPALFRKKISARSPILYYAIILSFLTMLIGVVIGHNQLASIGLAFWAALTGYFIFKRLYSTKLSLNHISEMIVTSAVIPFVSIFWQWYGAAKYHVLYI